MSKKVWLAVKQKYVPHTINPYDNGFTPIFYQSIYRVCGIYTSKKKFAKAYQIKKSEIDDFCKQYEINMYHVKLNMILSKGWQYYE